MAIDIFEKTNPEVFVLSGFFLFHNLKNRLDVIFWGFVFLFLLMHSGRALFCVRHFNIFVCYFVFFTCKSSNEARNNKWSCKQLSSNSSDETARFFFPFSTKRINSDTDAVFCVCYRLTFTTWSGFFVNKEGETDEKEIPRKCLARSSRNCWRFFSV